MATITEARARLARIAEALHHAEVICNRCDEVGADYQFAIEDGLVLDIGDRAVWEWVVATTGGATSIFAERQHRCDVGLLHVYYLEEDRP